MAGIEVLGQDATLIIDDIHIPRRRGYAMNRANPDDLRPLFAARFRGNRHDPPSTLADDTLIIDDIPRRPRRYAMNRANPDDVRQLFAARFREHEGRRREAIMNDLNLRRRGHQIVDDVRRLNGDEEQRQHLLSSEIWRYLCTENYERDECGGFCVVCQSELEEGEKLGKLRCGHSYHAPCIHTWLLRKNECPLCKQTAIPELQSLG